MTEMNNNQSTCIDYLQLPQPDSYALPYATFPKSMISEIIDQAIRCAAFRTVDNECHRKFFDELIPELEKAVLDSTEPITEAEKEDIMKLILVERSDEFVDSLLTDIVKGSEKYANRVQH